MSTNTIFAKTDATIVAVTFQSFGHIWAGASAL